MSFRAIVFLVVVALLGILLTWLAILDAGIDGLIIVGFPALIIWAACFGICWLRKWWKNNYGEG